MDGMVGNSLALDDYHQIFVERSKLLDPDTFDKLVNLARQTNQSLEPILIEKAFISPSQYLQLSADYFQLPAVHLSPNDIQRDALSLLEPEDAQELLAVPFDFDDQVIKIAVAHPHNNPVVSKVHNNNQLDIKLFVSTEQAIRQALIMYDPNINQVLEKISTHPGEAERAENSAQQLAVSIIETAVMQNASDVHLEPYEDTVLVRLRIDGVLQQASTIPNDLYMGVVTYFKVKSGLKIDQSRLPQDGRLSLSVKGQEVNIRLSLVPSLYGEKIVMRILPKEAHVIDINSLGLLDSDLNIIQRNVKRPFGMILVCGPTGSGKTTSLYAFIQEIGMDKVNIVNISTIEDPIEYTIPRVTQIQTQPEIDLTFSSGLRALLRQDPDIIMVGEIRDEETADISVRAALVGRLLLSSIHTNDAVGVIPRLLDMGVEPYLVASTLAMVVAQRLARKLCTYCRQSYQLTDEDMQHLGALHDLNASMQLLKKVNIVNEVDIRQLRFYKAVGCDKCDNTGYSGRTGLYEVLEINDEFRRSIGRDTNTATLKEIAVKNGMKTMFDDGLAKASLGIIDLPELLRVVYD
jgi:type IV pilus assembly protein PilB